MACGPQTQDSGLWSMKNWPLLDFVLGLLDCLLADAVSLWRVERSRPVGRSWEPDSINLTISGLQPRVSSSRTVPPVQDLQEPADPGSVAQPGWFCISSVDWRTLGRSSRAAAHPSELHHPDLLPKSFHSERSNYKCFYSERSRLHLNTDEQEVKLKEEHRK